MSTRCPGCKREGLPLDVDMFECPTPPPTCRIETFRTFNADPDSFSRFTVQPDVRHEQ